jgi:hypothetical protein
VWATTPLIALLSIKDRDHNQDDYMAKDYHYNAIRPKLFRNSTNKWAIPKRE